MANAQLETFLQTVKGDPELLKRIGACANLNAIAELAAGMGYRFSGIDLVKHQAEATLRLSNDELEPIADGVVLEGHLWLMRIVWS
jgi:predicted ribosomally synthesized peptide with nif11-like leader